MSYILEALKKADQERGIGAVPNLATPHEIKHPPTRSYRWLWLVVPLLVVNAVLVVMLVQDRDEVPATAEAPLEWRPPPTNEQPAQAIQQTSRVTVSEAPTPERTVLPESTRKVSSGELVMLPQPSTVQNPRPSLQPGEEADQRAGAGTTATDTSQLPSWYELPPEFRNRLDLPRLDLHVYSEQPKDRFIMVKLKKYREGETLESGLVLEEVLPDGMVMSHRGERFLVEK